MDPVLEKIKQFSDDQYSSDNRLKARTQLYTFCEHRTNFHHWVFDNLDFSNVTGVLELGCGNGTLWKENISKIPEYISIMLTDISDGMVAAAGSALGNSRGRFQFDVLDACRTHFHDASFQMIIANHMLYHIDDIHRILAEIERLLTDDGFAYASTLSIYNLRELKDVAARFDKKLVFDKDIVRGFCMENGEKVLSGKFEVTDRFVHGNDVVVRASEPLLFYLASTYEGKQLDFFIDKFDEFKSYLDSVLTSKGEIRLTNHNALFKFRKR